MAQSSYLSDERKLAAQGLEQGSKRTLPLKPEIADREGFGQAMQMKRDAENAALMPGGMPQRMNTLQRNPESQGLEMGKDQAVAKQVPAGKVEEVAPTKLPVKPVSKAPTSKGEGTNERHDSSNKEGSGMDKETVNPSPEKQANPVKTQAAPEKKQARATTPPAVATAMTRAQFEQIMRTTYGVATIRDASHDEQAQVNHITLTSPAVLPNWSSWGPGSSSFTYNRIVDGFAEFSRIWGGTPVVNEINFMRTKYVQSGGVVQEDLRTAASFGLYDLNIYNLFDIRSAPLPIGRSTTTSNSAQDSPSQALSGVRTTVHELSHGLGSAAAQPMYAGNSTPPALGMFTEWNRAIGWFGNQLYDIGVPEVATAIQAGVAPPSQYLLDKTNWNNGNWIQQPVTAYATTGPGEDFAESAMTYGVNPSLLQSRSPARYEFIHSRRALLQTRLRRPTPAGAATPSPAPVVP